MTINPHAAGATTDWVERSWTARDCQIYALGVGAGAGDPVGVELAFTTENSEGVPQAVLPTFASLVGGPLPFPPAVGDFDHSMLLHGEEDITIHGDVPLEGRVRKRTQVVGIHDKGSGALIVSETEARDVASSRRLFTVRRGAFIRGEGGWGGRARSGGVADVPDRPADHEIWYPTRPEQALIYRLSGDVNRIHSDPTVARRAGYERPILHGLCTFGFTGRALLHAVCDTDPCRFGRMRGRFTRPVTPGETIVVKIWLDGAAHRFRTETDRGDVVIDRGQLELRGPAAGAWREPVR